MSEQGVGKIIKEIGWGGDGIKLRFEDDSSLYIFDGGQCCCEHRYMTCDEENSFGYYIGSTYLGYDLSGYDHKDDDDYTVHEVQFLNLRTSNGVLVFANHNEHNGYYGGFDIATNYQEAVDKPEV